MVKGHYEAGDGSFLDLSAEFYCAVGYLASDFLALVNGSQETAFDSSAGLAKAFFEVHSADLVCHVCGRGLHERVARLEESTDAARDVLRFTIFFLPSHMVSVFSL